MEAQVDWINIGLELFMSIFIGYGAFSLICPKKKREYIANRITMVVALVAFTIIVVASLWTSSKIQHNLQLMSFLLGGLLTGIVAIAVIYGIAQLIHWLAKGKAM